MGLQIWKWVQNGHKMIKIKVNHLALVFKSGSTIQARLILSLSWISYWLKITNAGYLPFIRVTLFWKHAHAVAAGALHKSRSPQWVEFHSFSAPLFPPNINKKKRLLSLLLLSVGLWSFLLTDTKFARFYL